MKIAHMITIMTVFLLTFNNAQAYEQPPGWRWYNEPKPTREPEPKKNIEPQQNTVTTVMSATEQLEWFQKQYEEVKAAATIDPANLEKRVQLMRFNNYISEQSSIAGMTMKKALLTNPELSYTKDRPVEQAARSTYLAFEREKKERSVKEMAAEGWGFFFVYEGNDQLTKTLAPSIQSFANTYGIEVLGISKDGQTLESIQNNRIDDGRVTVPFTPALILVNPNTQESKPLAYGFISQNDLLGRFYNVATDYSELDF